MSETAAADADGVARVEHGPSGTFRLTPLRLRGYLALVVIAAVALPIVFRSSAPKHPTTPWWLSVVMLLVVSVLNVELSRALTGGLQRVHQPHKALSAWAFATGLLLPPLALLLVVPVTYAHARWRGLRLPLWKWVGSACYLVLAGLAAALIRHAIMSGRSDWMTGDGGRGLAAMAVAGVVFLAVETVLFSGSALLNHADDEVWLRATLTGVAFYATESGVLLIGGLLAAVWTGGPWFVLLFLPIYALLQRAALHEPLRQRAETATQLTLTNRELERANQFKLDLMGMLGHEIGNPLTAIQGFAELGAESLAAGDEAGAVRALETVQRNARQVEHVRAEILALVRTEHGALTAHPQHCTLAPLLRAAADTQPPECRPEVVCPEQLVVIVQPGHLDQILTNLLSNATKYARGATTLSAHMAANNRVEVAVSDAGPGVPDHFREHLFERFSRDDATQRRVVGTGLGLFIVKELARANQADIWHRDARPSGSVFVLSLPAAPPR